MTSVKTTGFLLAGRMLALACAMAFIATPGCASRRIITVSTTTETITSLDGARLTKHRLGPYPDALDHDFRPWGMVTYVQDSTPRPVLAVTPQMAEVIAMNMIATLVEHRGVTPDGAVSEMVFWIGSAHRKRVDDHLAAVYHDLPRLREPGPLIAIGSGAGGQVAAAMAHMEPRFSHLILLNAGGGWTGEEEMRHWLAVRGELAGMRSEAEIDDMAERIRNNPDSLEMLGSRAFTALAARLDRTILDELGDRELPILAVHAAGDSRIPVESSRALRDRAAALGLDLTYVEIEGADHMFRDLETGRTRYNEVELAITNWMEQEELISSRTAKRLRQRLRPPE